MKKIIIIFAAMAAVLSSCQMSEIESVSVNDGKDIVLNISVSNPGADDTKALIKEGWEENDQIKIWFDARTGENPDLVIKYDKTNNKWTQDGTAVFIPTSASGNVKAVYSNNVIVASNDTYTLSGNTLSFKIENWIFLTEIQVVVKGLWSDNASKYTLSCDEFTPLASTGNGYTVGENGITVSPGTKGTTTRGIPNKDGIAFVFATADYSSSSSEKKDFEFTIKEEGGIQQTYKPNVAIVAKDGKKSIKALTFANPNYVEIPADYDLNTSTPNTALKWHRQNLAISTSGNMKWKGGNASSAVKVPGSNENVIVGDYFQWGASYPGYSITNVADKKPENLLIYTSFTNTCCLNGGDTNEFIFKEVDQGKKYFFEANGSSDYIGISPYFKNGDGYIKYTSSTQGTLERTPDNDDVASIILGGSWRMPTCADFVAMREATYWAWDATDMGFYVFSPNETYGAGQCSNSIPAGLQKADALLFFPAAGNGSGQFFYGVGGYGRYWSSDRRPNETNYPHFLDFHDTNQSYPVIDPRGYYMDPRHHGFPVRPVSD